MLESLPGVTSEREYSLREHSLGGDGAKCSRARAFSSIRCAPLTAAAGCSGELSTDDEAVALLAEADAIVCLPYGGVVVDDTLAGRLPKLKHVQLLSAGFSEVTPQIAELWERGISVSNSTYF